MKSVGVQKVCLKISRYHLSSSFQKFTLKRPIFLVETFEAQNDNE